VIRMSRALVLLVCASVACATPAQVRQVENQVVLLRAENARADSIRARQFGDVVRLQQRLVDSLNTVTRLMSTVRGDLLNEFYGVQQQLVQLQELTGQSQRRLSELRAQLEARSEQLQQQIANTQAPLQGGTATGDTTTAAPVPSAAQMYEASLQALRRGSATTARAGFRELVKAHPSDERVPDALYFIGQSFADEPDSATAYYRTVADAHPKSSRAPGALYNLGLVLVRKKDVAGAKVAFDRVVKEFPRSDEAALARDQLKTLR